MRLLFLIFDRQKTLGSHSFRCSALSHDWWCLLIDSFLRLLLELFSSAPFLGWCFLVLEWWALSIFSFVYEWYYPLIRCTKLLKPNIKCVISFTIARQDMPQIGYAGSDYGSAPPGWAGTQTGQLDPLVLRKTTEDRRFKDFISLLSGEERFE